MTRFAFVCRFYLWAMLLASPGFFADRPSLRSLAEEKTAPQADAGAPPAKGEKAPGFSLESLEGEKLELEKLLLDGPVVLVVLRGWPGYQCPICNVQVGQFIAKAAKFEQAQARLVFVYPGPAEKLTQRAREFLREKKLPANVFFTIDPDYAFTNDWRLRWDAPQETAYPSTFVIDRQGVIRLAKISKSHGGRASADETLAALKAE